MYLSGVNYESIADGEGCRTTIFISGCKHNCPECQSPDTHSFTYGTLLDEKLIESINEEMNQRPFLSGITLSGGDPMYQPKEVVDLINKLNIPNNNIWCYTGFTFEQLLENDEQVELLKKIDVLVDGLFEIDKRDVTLRFCGSTNQRIIDVQKSLLENKIILV